MQRDANGNLDVARANPWTPLSREQMEFVGRIKLDANTLHALYSPVGVVSSEQGRLWALARTYLEIASMFAVKAATTGPEEHVERTAPKA